ncbi:metacaspase-3 [Coffea arabica]|uniref:Metacaspase-3 n=1 Tax=Coffea arabica TaxID=13443 RepID=A0A6P6VUK7_COFAR|nr:metacaspase-3-like isoform X1 [Coffea arabica]
MATRTEKCQWCGVNLLLPLQLQANSVRCPNCQYIIQLQHSPDLYFHPEGNGYLNGASNNCIGMGFPAYRNCCKQDFEPSWLNGYPRYMQSYQMPMQVLPPTFHGRKRAVLCGVSYKGHPKSLKGSVNDVLCMKYFLVERMGFPNSSVIVLTEEEKDPFRVPTKHNIQRALHWLVQGCQSGDSLVFHYSGHGSRVRDHDGDEIDGHDESLCPVDYETEGKILDDEINATIVRPLLRGATLHAIIDTCFSGTFLDLPFMCRMNREGYYRWVDHSIPYAAYKGTRGGLAISFSACDDDQNSGDTTVFTGTATGALTYSFIQTVEREPRLTYGRLLSTMRNSISKAQNGFLNFTSSLQEPQLSSSEQFDIYSKAIIL